MVDAPSNAQPGRGPAAWRTTVARATAGTLTVTIVAVNNEISQSLLLILAIGALWLVATSTVAVRRGWTQAQTRTIAVFDLMVLVAVAAVTGGATSTACFVLWLAPLAWAAAIDRTGYVALVFVAPLGYLLMWLPDGLAGAPGALGDLATFAGMYSGAVVVGLVTLHLRIQTANQAATLQLARTALIRELGLVERAEHERMSTRLHDGPLQALISARQDLDEYRDGDHEALGIGVTTLDEGISGLRGMISEFFQTDDTDIGTRITEICRRYEQRQTFAVDLRIDPSLAGTHNDMLVGIVGELIVNAAKHSKATTLLVAITPDDDGIAILVRDNGIGMAQRDRKRAGDAGHIGLSSLDRRVRALGGRWRIRSAPGRGTSVSIELPR